MDENTTERATDIQLEVRRGHHYRAYKVLLRADRFDTAEGFSEYWSMASAIAERVGISTKLATGDVGHQNRVVSFWDTPDFDLYKSGFILRRRRLMEDGFPADIIEHTLKLRHPDLELVSSADMSATSEEKCRVKFKEAILPAPERPSGMKSVFSHNGILKTGKRTLVGSLGELQNLFPVTKLVPGQADAPLQRVNNLLIEEIQADLGVLTFDRFITGADVSVWRNRGTGEALAGEFSWQSRFKEELTSDKRAPGRAKAEELYRALLDETSDWLLHGTTKTRAVYEYGGRSIECQE